MSVEERDVVADQGVHGAALESGRIHRLHGFEHERMMVEHQVKSQDHRLGDDRVHRVESEQDRPHFRIGITHSQTHANPNSPPGPSATVLRTHPHIR